MIKVKRALISVSDKTGISELGRFLESQGTVIMSTGGTLKALKDAGIKAAAIEEYTGFPEMMDGRLKTLHPKIHGGLLALEDNAAHVASMKEHGIEGIDLLVVNLYPFAATVAKGADFAEVIENIDIGGPTMLRAAAKNYRFTASVTDPADYETVMKEIRENGGISVETSLGFAKKVFNFTASYDAVIAEYLNEKSGDQFPEILTVTSKKMQSLRYGENPHQSAAFYRPVLDLYKEQHSGLSGTVQLQGKELSFNNMLDFSAALNAALALPSDGVVIVKHLNPCGVSVRVPGETMAAAYNRAKACDPVSAFGGVIAFSAEVDKEAALAITEIFVEGVIAPSFTAEALEVFAPKKNVRLMKISDPGRFLVPKKEIRQIFDGYLYEDIDLSYNGPADWKVVTEKKPTEADMKALEFAWRVVKHIKSNAIVFCSDTATLGIGAGQMSRIDSVEIAVSKSKKAGFDLKGSVAASDAFFPFRDGLDALANAGARAVIQPGGSIKDEEVIAAANEHGIIMVFTGMRHFRH